MTKLITIFNNNFNTIITIVFGLVIFYIIMYPYYLPFYFENTLGRIALLLFIIVVTYCIPIMGIFTTFIFIGLYNSRLIEGLETMNSTTPTNTSVTTATNPVTNTATNPTNTEASTPGIYPTKITSTTLATTQSTKPATSPSTNTNSLLPTTDNITMNPAQTLDKNVQQTVVQNDNLKKEAFNNRLSYSNLDEGRNRMLTIESYIRKPKSSNQMPFSKYNDSKYEPVANYSGMEGMKTLNSSVN